MTDKEADKIALDHLTNYLKPKSIPLWIRREVPFLEGRRPIDLIKEGKIKEVAKKLREELDDWDGF
jgi:hypothetical protein